MTDYVVNELKVYGKRKDLDKYKEDVSESGQISFSFNKIIPMPENLIGYDLHGNGEDWYHWQIENWGVKCGESDTCLADMKTYLFYSFLAPWNAPIQIFLALIDRYPNLDFKIITYTYFTDDLLLEIESSKSVFEIFKGYYTEVERFGNSILDYYNMEHDFLTETNRVIDEAPVRKYQPLL